MRYIRICEETYTGDDADFGMEPTGGWEDQLYY